jgi:starch phosphorylase
LKINSCGGDIKKNQFIGGQIMKFSLAQPQEFEELLERKVQRLYGRTLKGSSCSQIYRAISEVVADLVKEKWAYSRERAHYKGGKELYYLSMEFLIGKSLRTNLVNLQIEELVKSVCSSLGIDYEEIRELEPDAGLGNGGLGRLAACLMDSLTTLGMHGHGCGIRYEYGLFRQRIVDGYQVEVPDSWLEGGNSWEVCIPEESETVRFGGWVEPRMENGRLVYEHKGYQSVKAVPYDIPITGYGTENVNSLRLWAARSTKHLDMHLFGQGRYLDALEEKELAEVISKVLYPEDNHPEGKALRLKQQYFFISATIQGIVRTYKREHGPDWINFPKRVVIHINDTHPALAIPELMRLLLDEEGLSWEEAWQVVRSSFAYTNHTVMEEALERWPEGLFRELLPRLWDIVYEINERFCAELWQRYPGDWDRIARMSIIAYHEVRMANLCIVGSFSVNGVADLHTSILKEHVFRDFYQFFPEKFHNVTNGVTFRRFLLESNPKLADLISSEIGEEWITDYRALENLAPSAAKPDVQRALAEIRRANKVDLANYIAKNQGLKVDPDSIFDVHVKRIHEYKRQLLNILHVLHLYNRLKDDKSFRIHPRTFIFGGKAAPGYRTAKLIIKLIHAVGDLVNTDPAVSDLLKVVFLEDYRVSLAEEIIPAADVSEQISTAGKEASGTGNMKFMANGALTIGTMDGANVEIYQAVGKENMFIFGLNADETSAYYQSGAYRPYETYLSDPYLRQVVDQLVSGFLDPGHPEMFREIYQGLLYGNGGMADPFFVLKDFDSYREAHLRIDAEYQQPEVWWKKALLNIASAGRFASDRTVLDYNNRIWKLR